ncbi:MAG: hypothetical protein H5T86_15640, partial [Armatimonadetes bacterium]|nr:hypothetical protein [Armatimonadota bacterium]
MDEQVNRIRAAIRQGYWGPLQVVITEDELVRQLQRALAQVGAQEIGAKVTSDEIVVAARVPMPG